MGLQDRDYLSSRSSRLTLVQRGLLERGWVLLLLANLAVFLLWQVPSLWPLLLDQFTVSAEGLLEEGRVWTLFTSAFSHEGFWHLFWNMLFLWIFAGELEALYGRGDMLALYLFGALGAAVAHVCLTLFADRPSVPMLGASGAVMGIVVATTLFFPQRRLYLWGLVPVPLWVLAGAYLLMDVFGLVSTAQGGQSTVAHAGHLGGAAAGALFKLADLRLFTPSSVDGAALGPGLVARLRRKHSQRVPPLDDRFGDGTSRDPLVAAKIDELLRKINKEGLSSLNEEERRFLEEASEKLKR